MGADVGGIFRVIAYTVPGLMILGGILTLFIGYQINSSGMINGGWALVILGALIFIIELIISHFS